MAYRYPDKRDITPLDPPCRKRIYDTEEDALEMIRHIRETRSTRKIKAYRCSICGFWHLTSRTE